MPPRGVVSARMPNTSGFTPDKPTHRAGMVTKPGGCRAVSRSGDLGRHQRAWSTNGSRRSAWRREQDREEHESVNIRHDKYRESAADQIEHAGRGPPAAASGEARCKRRSSGSSLANDAGRHVGVGCGIAWCSGRIVAMNARGGASVVRTGGSDRARGGCGSDV